MRKRPWRMAAIVAVALSLTAGAALTAINTASAAVINTGAWYNIVNRNSGKALEITGGSTADQATVTQNTRSNANHQQFQFVDSGGGNYRLRARHSNKVIDLWEWNAADGAEFRQWPDLNANNQQFRVLDSAGGYVRLINRHSNKALEVWEWSTANGGRVSQFTDTNGNNQQWQLIIAGTGTTPTTAGPPPGGGPTTAAPPPPPTSGTPVARFGQLRVCGTRMCASNGSQVQLRGVSSMWLNWESRGYAENLTALRWMRDNWGLTVIRAAMGVEPAGAYLSDPARARGQVERIINNAVAAGVYVIV
ncbi:MAG TPA: RICIN domain-containing protein, partial [Pilimelia sp.]|nr:RICIN domain-containing protein [Pilimelia sp.]